MNKIKIQNIFAAVFDKELIDPLLEFLTNESRGRSSNVKFWGTEGTISYIKPKGFSGKSVVKGFDYSGRVKSLDRANFVRILADTAKKQHSAQLKREKLEPIDTVIVDLYAPDPKIFPESMDIGGQSLIRSAIKNYKNLSLAWDKKSILELTRELKAQRGFTTLAFRKKQAKAAAKFIAQRTKLEAKMFRKI